MSGSISFFLGKDEYSKKKSWWGYGESGQAERNKDMDGGDQEKEKYWRETQAALPTSPEPSLTSQPTQCFKGQQSLLSKSPA